MDNEKYLSTWLILVQFQAKEGLNFNELIGLEEEGHKEKYDGAWANVIVKAPTINIAIDIVPKGLSEKDFEMIYIDKAGNISSMVEDNSIEIDLLKEVDWLLDSEYDFMISEMIYPFIIS